MAVPAEKLTISIQEYLDSENQSPVKHEYLRGHVFAMVGASAAHNKIAGNIFSVLHARLKGSGCAVFISDMKLRVEAADSFYYPDVMVTCEPFEPKSLYQKSPVLIFEVLSPSTADIDRREKLATYGLIASLQEYVIVHQDKRCIEVNRKSKDGTWSMSRSEEQADLSLQSIPCGGFILALDDVYDGVFKA